MTAPNTSAVAADLTVGYGDHTVLGPVDFSLQPGVTALLGRNGSGKTTLMRTLCGIIPPLGGHCTVLGAEVQDSSPVRSRIGYLGHESALASALTVQDNLRFWESVTATYPDVTLLGTRDLVDQFDLGDLLQKKVAQLSRGQRQRVDLARLAMTDPRFIVLDEPLTGLDPVYAAGTRTLLRRWGEERTVLYSTHSVPEALEIAGRFLVVSGTRLVSIGADGDGTDDTDGTDVTERTILEALEATP
ncbi:ABC transporter ATP-binding protein [Corynebacterium kalidii]